VTAGPETPARVLLGDRGVVSVAPDATLGEAAREMQRRSVGSALVMHVEQGFVGIVTERDLLRAVAASRHPDQASVEEWMTADAITIGPETTRAEAAAIMQERGFRHLPVVADGRVVGVLSIRDLV
jgi:CBS domain-containing protein